VCGPPQQGNVEEVDEDQGGDDNTAGKSHSDALQTVFKLRILKKAFNEGSVKKGGADVKKA
jgi:hypothetical protein